MFYIRNGIVYLTKNQQHLCEAEQLNDVIQHLQFLLNDYQQKKEELELNEERYTPEGIDRFFHANPNFINDERRWKEDSIRDWKHLDGFELFDRYQIHAQLYCEQCYENDQEPSYQGFRDWLIFLRDGINYHENRTPTEER